MFCLGFYQGLLLSPRRNFDAQFSFVLFYIVADAFVDLFF